MPTADQSVLLYQELAVLCDRQGQAQMHDRFLTLAADAALSAGRPDEAERLRLRLLQQNPHHLLKPYASFTEAMRAPDVNSYVIALRRNHTHDVSERLLQSLRSGAGEAADDPSGQAAAFTDDRNVPADPRGARAAEALKVYRVQEPVEEPPESPADDDRGEKTRQTKLDPGEKPKVSAPWIASPAPPPKFNQKPVAEGADAAGWQLPPTQPALKPRAMQGQQPPPTPAVVRPVVHAKPLAQPRPAATPNREVYRVRPEVPRRERGPVPENDESDRWGGPVLVLTLLALLSVAGLVLGGYALVRPFLPVEWVP